VELDPSSLRPEVLAGGVRVGSGVLAEDLDGVGHGPVLRVEAYSGAGCHILRIFPAALPGFTWIPLAAAL
jgi:hypothetical protein